MSSSCLTARGVRPSPHVLSRGNVFFSTHTTRWPAFANQYEVAAPEGPPPTTNTSRRSVDAMSPTLPATRATHPSGRAGPGYLLLFFSEPSIDLVSGSPPALRSM